MIFFQSEPYDLIVIGAGTGGLTAAEFAAQLEARVALVEQDRLGGDCTWTGCVPSKALLKVAKVAHEARTADTYGLLIEPPKVDMSRVRVYVQQAMAEVYQHETPAQLTAKGIEVVIGTARFLDPHTIRVGERTLSAKKFIITTGAQPAVPPVLGLDSVPYLTNRQLFENDRLPERLLVMGAGPVGTEMAQAYARLGAQVTLIGPGLLPKEEPEVAEVMGRVFAREGIKFVPGLVSAARMAGEEIVLSVDETERRGDMLLVAAGRSPNVAGLALEQAGVTYSATGIPVDTYLRTNVKHIHAAGDCVEGNYRFTHFAGWQAFQAARNALLPLKAGGFSDVVPWTTFTDPEVAHVGLTEAEARQKYGAAVKVTYRPIHRADRAVAENDRDGFIKVVHRPNGKLLGATIVAARAGEAITEFALALKRGLKLIDLAQFIHVYPTYSTPVMRLAGQVTIDGLLEGTWGGLIRGISRMAR